MRDEVAELTEEIAVARRDAEQLRHLPDHDRERESDDEALQHRFRDEVGEEPEPEDPRAEREQPGHQRDDRGERGVRYWRFSRLELWVAAIVAAAGLAFGLLVGVLVGVPLTLFLVLRELDHVVLTELQPDDRDDLRVAGSHTTPVPGLLVLRFEGPLYAANIRSGNRAVLVAVDAHPGTRTLVLDMTVQSEATFAVAAEYEQFERDLRDRGVTLWVAGLPPRSLAFARQLPAWQRLDDAGRLFPTALAAVRAYRAQ
jgi:MFS superfamily sulfate permease-like transporter